MKNNHTISIINTLTKSEIRSFRKFMASPFYCRRKDFPLLFNTIVSQLARKKGLGREELFQKTYPGTAYNDLKLRAGISDLKELLESFLATTHLTNDETLKDLALLAFYGERKLIKSFKKKSEKIELSLAQSRVKSSVYFQKKLQWQKLTIEDLARQKRTSDLPLQEMSDQIDAHFILEKLKHACVQLSHQLVYKTQYDFGLLKDVLSHLEGGKFMDIPPIAIRYYCFQFLSHPKEKKYFDTFRNILFSQDEIFDAKELKDLYLLGLNFCIRQLNQGNEYYAKEAWQFYQRGLEASVFLEDGRLSRFTFNNVVGIGINLREFDWLHLFIEKYQIFLVEQDRESIIYFNQARIIYHEKKDYHAIIMLLQKVESKDIVENLMAKTVLAKVYYELGEFDVLEAHLNSFQQYVRRGNIGKYHKLNYNSIIRMIKKLLSLGDYDKAKKDKLRQEVLQAEVLTERNWLLEQL